LGRLLTGRPRLVTGLLVLAVVVHVAAIIFVLFVLATWTLYEILRIEPDLWMGTFLRACFVGATVVGIWGLVHFYFLGMADAMSGDRFHVLFDLHRFIFLIRGFSGFFALTGGAAAFACLLAAWSGDPQWRLPASCLIILFVAGLAFTVIGNKYPHHPLLHPVGRLASLAPIILLLITLAMCGRLLRFVSVPPVIRTLAVACALVVLGTAAWHSSQVLKGQFARRPIFGLGPLYARLLPLSSSPDLGRTGFVFFNHNFGTVLSAARLYYGRYFWAKIYSANQLQRAVATRDRLIYLEGPGDPPFRVSGFCVRLEETVPLGFEPGPSSRHRLRFVEAVRCGVRS